MYLNINLKNVKKEEVRKVLESIGVAFEEFNSPLEMFLKEEADFRLQTFLDECKDGSRFLSEEKIELLSVEEKREELVNLIADEYFNKEIFNYDFMDDIRYDVIEEFLNEYFRADLRISKEKLKEISTKLSIDDISELEAEYVDNIKIESDTREVIGEVRFVKEGYEAEIVLCSGQTNYWLEASLIFNNYTLLTTEPFFDLNDRDIIEMNNGKGTTFIVDIKSE